jgi:hypothetical protein
VLPLRVLHFSPLLPGDSETQTLGCRHKSAQTCMKHSLTTVCALVRRDGLCLAPPGTWKAYYRGLVAAMEEEGA